MKLVVPGAFVAFDDELIFLVVLLANGAEFGAVAGSAEGEVVEPLGVLPRGVGPALGTLGAPLALPWTRRHLLQRRLQAVDVIGHIAFFTQNLQQDQIVLDILFVESVCVQVNCHLTRLASSCFSPHPSQVVQLLHRHPFSSITLVTLISVHLLYMV